MKCDWKCTVFELMHRLPATEREKRGILEIFFVKYAWIYLADFWLHANKGRMHSSFHARHWWHAENNRITYTFLRLVFILSNSFVSLPILLLLLVLLFCWWFSVVLPFQVRLFLIREHTCMPTPRMELAGVQNIWFAAFHRTRCFRMYLSSIWIGAMKSERILYFIELSIIYMHITPPTISRAAHKRPR